MFVISQQAIFAQSLMETFPNWDHYLWTGAAFYARYRFVLISNKLCDWTVAQMGGGGGGGEGATGFVLSEWGGAVTVR